MDKETEVILGRNLFRAAGEYYFMKHFDKTWDNDNPSQYEKDKVDEKLFAALLAYRLAHQEEMPFAKSS